MQQKANPVNMGSQTKLMNTQTSGDLNPKQHTYSTQICLQLLLVTTEASNVYDLAYQAQQLN